ncbi:hypothetical protein LCGC14_3009010, partial [marine sediment metagenome]
SKMAQRLALHILTHPDDTKSLVKALIEAKQNVRLCNRCFNFSSGDICDICADENRGQDIFCVVEEAKDIIAVERTGSFKGLYHVLGGAIVPMDGIGPENLKIPELLERLKKAPVNEVVLAMNPNIEGEATAMYLAKLLKPLGVKVTRIASGLPVGGDLEYADEMTLTRAVEGRREY